ncbi:hypothetical protein KL930_005293 [Ogataea haglerorum]|uniref:SP-RING-type domain-containing protein n=1 Tax=Ogataea haglerorum TaxID=1937702 RepID=A0ABQ7R975_9ASCO|nr:uncharacterized protein KL911_004720 [Ogataea haglerorum]KAG7691407.1 hypothetical protein KL915_005303 [Ogataea haglerorum]KAG7691816.1 hypothetical protein KL951_005264 [Ogataea haglerorum]KAG7702211.1 hypothetical protein KL914_005342 [Ogataea haglerorum]KAG7702271.1 hypothetical protein KL950_005321 [Ogataea haglerorum]KAG7713021.1 hypothetical protein KL949_005315 [Ogataea haglerorum]
MKREQGNELRQNSPSESPEGLFQLPAYYPLTKKFKSELRQLNPAKTIDSVIKETRSALMETLFEYIDNQAQQGIEQVSKGNIAAEAYEKTKKLKYKEDPVLLRGKRVLEKLNQTRRRQATYLAAFQKARTEILDRRDLELSLEDLERYAHMEDIPSQVHDLYQEVLSANVTESASANELLVKTETTEIDKKLFVAINPTEPIPFNDQEDDDEIEVGGGKVNLTCPISRLIMKNPVKNKKCGHTYDKASLANYNSTDCPECGATIQKSELVEDTLMKIRIACYERDQKLRELYKTKVDEDIDRL